MESIQRASGVDPEFGKRGTFYIAERAHL